PRHAPTERSGHARRRPLPGAAPVTAPPPRPSATPASPARGATPVPAAPARAEAGAPDASSGSGGRVAPPRRRRVLLLCDAYWNPHGGTEGQIRALVENLPSGWEARLWVVHHSPWLDENPFACPAR